MKASQLQALAFSVLAVACSHKVPQPEAPSAAMPPPKSATVTPGAGPAPRTLDQMLAGKISGVSVTPGPAGGIVVRITSGGPTSFNDANEGPLFIVDGTPVEARPGGALPWINPRDVESITALKNPADLAIYGSRGGNGVIVIKTKNAH